MFTFVTRDAVNPSIFGQAYSVAISTGVSDANKVVVTGPTGLIDPSLIPGGGGGGTYTFSTGLVYNALTSTVTVDFAPSGTSSTTQAVRADDSRLSDARTPLSHVLDSSVHTISGKTAGQVLIATSPTTFGFVTFTGDISVAGTGATVVNSINGVQVSNLALTISTTTLNDNISVATPVSGAQWPVATYRSVTIEYQITRGTNYSIGRIRILYDGTNARLTDIEEDFVGSSGVTFTADINSGNMRLLYQTTSTGSSATMLYTGKPFNL